MKINDNQDLRFEISRYLNGAIIGLIEGTIDGIKASVVDNLKRRFGLDVSIDSVNIIIDKLQDPVRTCWSIHVEHEGGHYESVIRNLKYDDGYEA